MQSLREDGDGIREGKPRTGKTRWEECGLEEDEVMALFTIKPDVGLIGFMERKNG